MNILELTVLVTLYFILTMTMLALWWTANRNRRQIDGDIRWHRETLLKEIRAELVVQENRLGGRIRTP